MRHDLGKKPCLARDPTPTYISKFTGLVSPLDYKVTYRAVSYNHINNAENQKVLNRASYERR